MEKITLPPINSPGRYRFLEFLLDGGVDIDTINCALLEGANFGQPNSKCSIIPDSFDPKPEVKIKSRAPGWGSTTYI